MGLLSGRLGLKKLTFLQERHDPWTRASFRLSGRKRRLGWRNIIHRSTNRVIFDLVLLATEIVAVNQSVSPPLSCAP